MALTPLIDVIFLLLLFFMLSSTFSRFGEIKLDLGGARDQNSVPLEAQIIFLSLGQSTVKLNGKALAPNEIDKGIRRLQAYSKVHLLIDVLDTASSQDLLQLMYRMKRLDGLKITVLR